MTLTFSRKVTLLAAAILAMVATKIVLATDCITPGGRPGKGVREDTTLTYYISDTTQCPVLIEQGFQSWTDKNAQAGGNRVRFKKWDPSVDGPTPNINVSQADLGPFSTTGASTSVARDSEMYITGGAIRINSNNAANPTCDGYKKATMHEAGHMQNLRDTFGSNGSSVMNQYAGADETGGNIPADVTDCDRNAVFNQSIKGRLPGETDDQYFTRCAGDETDCDPIILDLDGKAIRLSSSEVAFDIGATGEPFTLSWTTAGAREGFLVLDRNQDGVISDGRELFGDVTPLSWTITGTRAHQGFEALAFFDRVENGGNADGLIDEHDRVFGQLSVWIDDNHDGVSQPIELKTLRSVGVISIVCEPKEWSRRDGVGNVFGFRAPMVLESATGTVVRYAYDAFLVAR